MRKVGDLMKDLGFREEGSNGVKEAFIKNLIRAAQGAQPLSSKTPEAKPPPNLPQNEKQLSFDLGEERVYKPRSRQKRSS